MQGLKHILLYAKKDLKLFVIDRQALFFFVIFPFLFVVLFNFVLSGVGTQDSRLELHLVTQETNGLSQQIISAMETRDASQLKPGEPIIIWDKSYDDDLKAVQDKTLGGFLAFPSDFTQGVLMGYGTQLKVITDSQATTTQAAINGLAQGISSQVGALRVTMDSTISLLVKQGIATGDFSSISQEIQKLFSGTGFTQSNPSLITYDVQKVGEVQSSNSSNYVIPGYLVMFVFFGAALGSVAIVQERRNGTLERLLASSVKKSSILGGIFAGTAAKGLVQILIFWIVGILLFHIDLGLTPGAVILLSILMVLMSAAFSVMIATFAKTERGAASLSVIISLVMAPLGGCWWPLFIVPAWMQFIAKFTPHGWATTGFNKLMVFGGDFSSAAPEMLALAGFGVAFAIIALRRFRTSAV